MTAMMSLQSRMQRFIADRRGLAAVEFAMIAPLMLLLFFGTVEMSSGVAVDRKVTLVTRTLSDLTSQATTMTDTDIRNVFAASYAILYPYPATPVQAKISEIYINASRVAKVQWSKAATVAQSGSTVTVTLVASDRSAGDTIAIPTALAVPNTYLIFSEVSYLYVPTVGYVMNKAGITLSDVSYTRPRQSTCVLYSTSACPTS